jgi:hypothetical protein
MPFHLIRALTGLLIAIACTQAPGQSPKSPGRPAAREPVTLNFSNAEIEAVTRTMASIIGRDIVVDPRVKGTISLSTEQPVPPQVAYENFLGLLRLSGYTIVDSGGLLKVVPEADAKLQGGPVSVGTAPAGTQLVTQIFRLTHESALITARAPITDFDVASAEAPQAASASAATGGSGGERVCLAPGNPYAGASCQKGGSKHGAKAARAAGDEHVFPGYGEQLAEIGSMDFGHRHGHLLKEKPRQSRKNGGQTGRVRHACRADRGICNVPPPLSPARGSQQRQINRQSARNTSGRFFIPWVYCEHHGQTAAYSASVHHPLRHSAEGQLRPG